LWAVHHPSDIGSTRLKPKPIPFAIAGFGRITMPVDFDPEKLFADIAKIKAPTLDALMAMDSEAKATIPFPSRPATAPKIDLTQPDAEQEATAKKNRTSFEPPIGEEVNLKACALVPANLLETVIVPETLSSLDIFLSTRALVYHLMNPLTVSDEDDDDDDTQPFPTADERVVYTLFLQFLWLSIHKAIPSTSTEMTQDNDRLFHLDGLQDYRIPIRNEFLGQTPTTRPSPNEPVGAHTAFSEAANAIVKVSENIQRITEDSSKNSTSKRPGFDRFVENTKRALKFCASPDGETAPEELPAQTLEFFAHRNTHDAGDSLRLTMADEFGASAAFTGLLVCALYTGRFCWERPDTPGAFSAFRLSRRSAADSATDSTASLARALRDQSGAALSEMEAKELMKSVLQRPGNMDEAKYQIHNLHLTLWFLFGGNALLTVKTGEIVTHISKNYSIYETMALADPDFPTKLVYYVDISVQQVIRSAHSASKVEHVSWSQLKAFDRTRLNIETRQFFIQLPRSLMTLTAPKAESKSTKENQQKGDKGKKNDYNENKTDANQRKNRVTNPDIVDEHRIKTSEKYGDIFPRGKDKILFDKLPLFNDTEVSCCMKWHSAGFCFKDCERCASHGKQNAPTKAKYTSFMKDQRVHAKQ
jgi:hypothetical protein